MLTADEIDDLTFGITELYQNFHSDIIGDIARRIGALDYAKPTAALQVQRLSESGMLYNDILDKISLLTGKSEAELRKMFKDAGVVATKFDDAIYKAYGLNPLPLNLSHAMQEVLVAGLQKTSGVIKNLTMTTALAGQEAYLKATDLAYMQISTGTQSYTSAIRQAVKEMSSRGLTTVQFAKHVDQIDVAVRRAAITGVSQTAGVMQMTRMEEMGVDLVAVSAHIGARPSHALWQGKVYSRKGTYGKYDDLVEVTGYGSGEGLMGWNCRHSMYPYFEGLSEQHYREKELNSYANATVPYNEKDIPFYEATQMQRGMEREIRKWKREADALAKAKVDNTPEVAKVQQAQAKLRDFIKQTGLMRQREREGFKTVIYKTPKSPATTIPKPPVISPVKPLPPEPKPTFKEIYTKLGDDELNKFEQGYHPWLTGLNAMERNSLHNYTGSAYQYFNDYLRGSSKYIDDDAVKQMSAINMALSRTKIPENVKLFRHFRSDALVDALEQKMVGIGDAFTDKGFMSTSLDSGFGKPAGYTYPRSQVWLEIHAKAGMPGGYISEISEFRTEFEMLLPQGANMKIIEMEYLGQGTGWRILAEYVE